MPGSELIPNELDATPPTSPESTKNNLCATTSPPPRDAGRYPCDMRLDTEIQPADYLLALENALNSWWYLLTFLLPALVYAFPALKRWRFTLLLFPVAFIAACVGYVVYWLSIDWALMNYYERTGYFNTADTWYVFMPFFRGIPNAIVATAITTVAAGILSLRPARNAREREEKYANDAYVVQKDVSVNPYTPPKSVT